jgi:hypothetical protein
MPRSTINAITTVLRPAIEKNPGYIINVTMKEPSIRPNIIKNIELSITPAVHTHFLPSNVPIEKMINITVNTNHTTEDNKVPKRSKG